MTFVWQLMMHRMTRAEHQARADVLVVGAGPAGATAARTLAAAGVSTMLLDRAAFPRHKPCGGALSARVTGRFPYLQPALHRIATHWISRLHLEGPAGGSVTLESDTPAALMIRRIEFDALLAALAGEAGARMVAGAEVAQARQDADHVAVTTRDGRSFSGRYLIACDGVHSVTARKLGIVDAWPRNALAIDMMEETPNGNLHARDPRCLWVQYGCRAPGLNGSTALWEGYGYVFPKRDHVNVGIGYLLPAYRAASQGPAYASHRAFVERLRARGIVEGESQRGCFTPFLIPVSGPRRLVSKGRVLLAGDAAGFVHGLTAEGIYYAMVSGDLAARTIIEALHSNGSRHAPDLSGYSRACSAEIGQELRDSVLLQRYMFSRPHRLDAAVAGASSNDTVSSAAVRYLAGHGSYRSVRELVVSRNPGLVLSLAVDALRRQWRLWRSLRA
jgi:geranylgeranyl reductase family protein